MAQSLDNWCIYWIILIRQPLV